MSTLQELLAPQVIFESVTKQLLVPGDSIQRFFGMQLGGGNFERTRFGYGSYDIFDDVRAPAQGRAPNTGPATLPPQAVKQQPVTLARSHEKIPMYYHALH